MKRIILFRYHHQFERNKELLRFYKYLNPEIKIFGLYGGTEEDFAQASQILDGILENNYILQLSDPDWKWKNSDMGFQAWYNDFGHTIDFDMLHIIEWDLLLFEPIDKLFAHVPQGNLALTGLIKLEKIKNKWYWTRNERKKKEWEQLLEYFKTKHQYNHQPMAMIGPATTLPRAFLDKVRGIQIPDLSNDEVRIPMLAQVFGFEMHDTGFFRKWFSKKEFRYFNANSFVIEMKYIKKELEKKYGRRAFHPCNQDFTSEDLINLHELTKKEKKPFFSFKN